MAEFFSVDQVARHLNLHPKTIRRYIRSGQLPAKRLGKAYRIAAPDLDQWLGDGLSVTDGDRPISLEVSTQLDIRGVTSTTAANLTRDIMAVNRAGQHSRADCLYYEPSTGERSGRLKVLLFGTADYTEQMLKHINLLIARSGIHTNPQ